MIDLSIYETRKTIPVKGKSSLLDVLNKDIKFFNSSFSDKKKERFYAELNILFSAGVDIKTSLELIEEQQTKESDKQLFNSIRSMVESGKGLAAAVEATGKFSPYEFYSMQIGEESGRLPEVLEELAQFFSKKIKQKRQVMNALSYPIVLVCTALGVVAFMMAFVVPMFSDLFKRFNSDLPYITKLVIGASQGFGKYAFLGSSLFLVGYSILYYNRKKTWYRKYSSALVMKTPVINKLVQKIYLARFCQSMNLLTAARTPLINALELVRKMIGFYPIEVSLEVVQKDIVAGAFLHKSLAKFPIYNARMRSLIKVAEEVNRLDEIFGKLAKQYSDEVEHETGLIGKMIEPLMILFLGVLIGLILVAMYLPMFQLSTAFH